MNSLFRNTLAKPGAVLALAMAGILSGGVAHAAGTASGLSVSNLATLSYAVGGTAQTNIGSSATGNTSGAGTATSFVVDNKVNLTVLETSNLVTSVAPSAPNQVTTFTVTNLGNTAQGYSFVAANVTGAVIAGTADTLNVTNIRVFIDSNGNGVYDLLTDTASAILTLAPDASATVFVVADMPAGANGAQANVSLTATTTTAGTATAVTETTGANTTGVDIVFADAATVELEFAGTSAARDGKATARDAYRIALPMLTVTKASSLVCDPFNGTANAKSIPGAIVRWTLTVSNAAGAPASATLATVVDALAATNTTFDPNLVTGSAIAPATATSCTSTGGTPESGAGKGFKITQTNRGINGVFLTNTSGDTDGASITSTTVTIDYAQALPAVSGSYTAGELKAGESVVVYFNTTIN